MERLFSRKDHNDVENAEKAIVESDAKCIVQILLSCMHVADISFEELLYHFSRRAGLSKDVCRIRVQNALKYLVEAKRIGWAGSEKDSIYFNRRTGLLGLM